MKQNKLGQMGEIWAKNHLENKGYTFVMANYRTRFGEIDLIFEQQHFLVFVEVKLRNQKAYYTGEQAVHQKKQQKIIATTSLFLSCHPTELQPRFDVISICTDDKNQMISVEHYENAFGGY